jgi:hypothetical protein
MRGLPVFLMLSLWAGPAWPQTEASCEGIDCDEHLSCTEWEKKSDEEGAAVKERKCECDPGYVMDSGGELRCVPGRAAAVVKPYDPELSKANTLIGVGVVVSSIGLVMTVAGLLDAIKQQFVWDNDASTRRRGVIVSIVGGALLLGGIPVFSVGAHKRYAVLNSKKRVTLTMEASVRLHAGVMPFVSFLPGGGMMGVGGVF